MKGKADEAEVIQVKTEIKTEIDSDQDESVLERAAQDVPYLVYMDRADSEEVTSNSIEGCRTKRARNGRINTTLSTTTTTVPVQMTEMKPTIVTTIEFTDECALLMEVENHHPDLEEKGEIASGTLTHPVEPTQTTQSAVERQSSKRTEEQPEEVDRRELEETDVRSNGAVSLSGLRSSLTTGHSAEVVDRRPGQRSYSVLKKLLNAPVADADRALYSLHEATCGKEKKNGDLARNKPLDINGSSEEKSEVSCHDQGLNRTVSVPEVKGDFECEICGARFEFEHSFLCHAREHKPEDRQKGFQNGHAIKRIGGDKPYKCEVCGKAYVQKRDLASHKERHR
ncbi:zinc finger and SCAN domain-containing protein 5C [Aplysia californica]|uniref:Zinc finger and SCAN domain-containing protein 5C n=1 Tax=Aplysia californica TaxID=6500 RepID=A0ABM0K9H4_APLCA|nr:zinc finger and SCAN domain-containing protein 5C [Aplysia californica]